MKKKPDQKDKSAIVLPTTIKNEFRKICIMQDLKPSAVTIRLFSNWIEKEKKKCQMPITQAANF